MRKVTAEWTMRDGNKIRICDMGDMHLENTIALCEREAKKQYDKEIAACMSITFTGEQAQYEQDKFLSQASPDDYMHPLYEKLCEEAERRGIRS